MSGGIWNGQNKIRPGVYQNIYSTAIKNNNSESNGLVAIALDLKFGKEKAITKIESETDIFNKLGYTVDEADMLLIREMLKATNTILIYRLNGGQKAQATVEENKTISAVYGGSKGNDISVVIANNVEDETKYDVITYMKNTVVDTQTITNYEEFVTNGFIQITGTGKISEASTTNLENGTDNTSEKEAYSEFLQALELENCSYIAYCGTDETTKALIKTFLKRMNDEEGVRLKAVMGEYKADYEKIITIKNGVVLEDGTTLTKEQCAAFVAALSASSDITKSNTFETYPNAVDCNTRLNNSDTEKALQAGNIVFTRRNDNSVVIEQDINSLTTYTKEKNRDFSKNRVVRTLDMLAQEIKEHIEQNYIGKINNNEDGRNILRADIINIVKEKEERGAVQNFSEEDVTVEAGDGIESVLVNAAIQPVDSIEKIYMNIEVK